MFGFDDDKHTEWVQSLLKTVRHLGRQSLLHLGTTGEPVNESCELRQPGHPPSRQVGDMSLSMERDEVVLTHGVEGNLLDHHYLLIVLLPEEGIDDVARVLVETREHFGIKTGNTLGCLDEALPHWILPYCLEDLPDCLLDSSLIYFSHRGMETR